MSASSQFPSSMRAWTYSRRGHPHDVLSLQNVPTPSSTLAPNDVLVRISYAALNPVSYVLMQLVPAFVRKSPFIPEVDFSGVIEATGSGVSADVRCGAKVFGILPPPLQFKNGAGALAEYLVLPENLTVSKPKDMALDEAAGLALVGCTALQVLENSKLKAGDSVLVNGGSGGTGLAIIQLAKDMVGKEGRVVATCSGGNVDMVKRLGADDVVDYTKHDALHEHLRAEYTSTPFDAIIDTVGVQPLYTHSPAYLKADGLFLNIGSGFGKDTSVGSLLSVMWSMIQNLLWPKLLGGTPRSYSFISAAPDSKQLGKLKRLAEEGKLKMPVDSLWSMEDGLKAYERIKSRRAKGKVIIKVQEA
ncbi:zinc ion binding [Varicellaria rhodocarpa]|nr:zinc ion binding [Varicellaria rhodocarpa]